MSVGLYGNRKLADVDFNDVDILYAYAPNRTELGDLQWKPLFSNISNNEFRKILGADGGYKLRLPSNVFNQLGFYMIQIKPKTFETTIQDCSFIVQNNDDDLQISRKGVIIPTLQFQRRGALIGYQIEYFDDNDQKIKNFHRIVTSSELVSVSPANNSNNQGSTTYNLDPQGTQLFLNLTPDEQSLIADGQQIDLGKAGQKILISNTFFDPKIIEVEMTDQTIKTLSYGIFGNSTKDLDTGVFSIFDESGNLYKQYNLFTRKKRFSDGRIDVKEERDQINLDQNFFNISQGLT